jgi:hypothetical protein
MGPSIFSNELWKRDTPAPDEGAQCSPQGFDRELLFEHVSTPIRAESEE